MIRGQLAACSQFAEAEVAARLQPGARTDRGNKPDRRWSGAFRPAGTGLEVNRANTVVAGMLKGSARPVSRPSFSTGQRTGRRLQVFAHSATMVSLSQPAEGQAPR